MKKSNKWLGIIILTLIIGPLEGFLNGSTELNNICTTLYSNKELGLIARNMTIEDVNKACGYTPSEEVDRYVYYPYETDIDKMKSYIEYNGNNYISRVTDDKLWNYFYASKRMKNDVL